MIDKSKQAVSLHQPDIIPDTDLMQTKFIRPRVSSDVISRDSFFERLNAGLRDRVTLVCAHLDYANTRTTRRPTAGAEGY